MRNLVSIQKIEALHPIEGADRIELARVLGWTLIVNKGDFQVGDPCVYFEVDSYLPAKDERYGFLHKNSYRNNPFMGEGLLIKTMKMRGCISQGLALPLFLFPELADCQLEEDVTERLGVIKWELPDGTETDNATFPPKPYGIRTTDETRVQSKDSLRQELLGKPYYISTKMDGSSCTIYNIDSHIGVCSRKYDLPDDDSSVMWRALKKNGTIEKIRQAENLVFQGEFCGPNIQKNPLDLKEHAFYVFNIFDYKDHMRLMGLEEMLKTCEKYGLNAVPIEEQGDDFQYSLEALLERAKGKYPSGKQKEGIVVRPLEPFYNKDLQKSLSFKVINNDYLLKNKD